MMSAFSESDKLLNVSGRASSSSPSRIVDSFSTVAEDSGNVPNKGETDIENSILAAGARKTKHQENVPASASDSSKDFIANEGTAAPRVSYSAKLKEKPGSYTIAVEDTGVGKTKHPENVPSSVSDSSKDLISNEGREGERGSYSAKLKENKRPESYSIAVENKGAGKTIHEENIPSSASDSSKDLIENEGTEGKRVSYTAKLKENNRPESCTITVDDKEEGGESGPETDVKETNDSEKFQLVSPRKSSKFPLQYDSSIDTQLPETVSLLRTPDGSKIYLVGTAHFSIESQEDVAKIIRAVQPHVVMVELCKARVNILQLDEKTILEEAKNINFEKIRSTIKENGLFHGLMYMLLLSMSAHLTKQLGMAPGGEFRRAFAEAKQVPACLMHLGDRPIHITLQRALASLSWWQTIRLTWHLLMSKEPISKEEVERCKRRDLLEEMLAEMAGEFPALGTVFVNERDIYLTHSLQLAALPQRTSTGLIPSRVVGVVGIGHVRGIVENWGKVSQVDIPPIMQVPPPSLTSRMLKLTFKASLVGLVVWGVTRFVPLPKYIPNSVDTIRSSVQGFLHIGGAAPGPGKV